MDTADVPAQPSTPNQPPDNRRPWDPRNFAFTFLTVAGLLASFATLQLDRGAAIALALAGGALICAGWVRDPGGWIINTVVGGALVIVAVLVLLAPNVVTRLIENVYPNRIRVAVVDPPPVKIEHPNTVDLNPQPGCFDMRWTIERDPSPWAYVIMTHVPGEPWYYFNGGAKRDPETGQWSLRVFLGNDESGQGMPYDISVVALPREWALYMTYTRPHPAGETWWASMDFPPQARIVEKFRYVRDSSKKRVCPS